MAELKFKQRLEKLADTLPRLATSGIEPLPYDKYLMMSLMQKACRRGDGVMAAQAALTLWTQDRRALWRRLAMIAVEDVGMGDIDTVLDVLAAAQNSAWRKAVGEGVLGTHLARRMARSVKTRYLTELYLYSDLSNKAANTRQWAAKASFKELSTTLHASEKDAAEQALALCGLFGSKRFETKNYQRPDGDVEAALKAVKAMSVPEEILSICTATVGMSYFPLAMLLPVGWLEMQRQAKHLTVRKETPVSSPEVDGLPLYAVDGLYTRTGISCVKSLKKTVTALTGYSNSQIGEGYFFIEAETLNPRLTCPAWDDFRKASIFAVMQDLGLQDEDYMALHRALIKHYDLYNDIRMAKVGPQAPPAPDMFGRCQ